MSGLILFFVLGVQPAWSAIGPSSPSVPSVEEAPIMAATVPNGLVLSLERMLQARWEAIEPTSISNPNLTSELIAHKLSALGDLDAFARMTVSGLLQAARDAANESELEIQLVELLARWNFRITDARDTLLAH